ncbi:MAG: hypothetical protein HC840_30315, partial [Leptolyngbyaceae cyanobacterium RM2_2_4]|nr:hypothetical protein [Leptolyngbyaceae cyanobacterium RM2_2_4]
IGAVPFILVLNKLDLQADWELEKGAIAQVIQQGWTVIESSAKTGLGVEEAFLTLTQKWLKDNVKSSCTNPRIFDQTLNFEQYSPSLLAH